jgi:hypothetical protein
MPRPARFARLTVCPRNALFQRWTAITGWMSLAPSGNLDRMNLYLARPLDELHLAVSAHQIAS